MMPSAQKLSSIEILVNYSSKVQNFVRSLQTFLIDVPEDEVEEFIETGVNTLMTILFNGFSDHKKV
jgi:hypothetical protein